MTSLVTCLGVGKGTWAYTSKLIEAEPWEKVFIITEEFGLKFTPGRDVNFVIVKEDQLLAEMIEAIVKQMENKVPDTEVALNMISGSGKMHMATLSALMKCGLGLRLVAMTSEGMKEV